MPDFAADQGARRRRRKPGGIGLDALSGTDPFIMKPDGVGWLYVPTGLVDGPLPDALRAGRIAGAEPALQAAVEPGAQVLEARRQSRWRRSAIRVSRT